ncbi:MAG TPA: hypothetical protein VEK57_07850 [Thermoanaerobaculia bacterium]|nr:hypothetical protein [Thermoanaerobaculia bacterium]
MTGAATTGEEIVTGVVFRLAKVGPRFPPDSRKPLSIHFEFSTADREEAVARGKWWLSVWDLKLTSPSQARGHLGGAGADYLPFGLTVENIRTIEVTDEPEVMLRVFRDPLPPSRLPGGEGHCGIDGLHQSKRIARYLRSALADHAFPLE